MNENENKPNGQRQLSDNELELVSGGSGEWDAEMEKGVYSMFEMYQRRGNPEAQDGYEAWLSYHFKRSPDFITCRNAWIEAGKPSKTAYRIKRDGVMHVEAF